MRRRLPLAIASLALLLAAGCTAGSDGHSHPDGPSMRPVFPHEVPVIEIAAGDVFGGQSAMQIDAYMQSVQELGIKVIRTDIKWSDAQLAEVSPYDWTAANAVFEAATKHGISVHAIIDSAPKWAVDAACPEPWRCAPLASAEPAMAAYAAAVASRFHLNTLEVENEPNSMKDYAQDPRRYARVYQQVYDAVRAVNQDVAIEPGGTAAIGTSGPDGLSAPDWYKALYAANIGGIMNFLAVHPYTFPATPADGDPNGNWAQLSAIVQIIADNHDGPKLLDINEMGFPTGGGALPPAKARQPQWQPEQPVSEANQALFYGQTIGLFEKLLIDDQAFRLGVYTLRDSVSGDQSSLESHFGLIRSNGSHKPAWNIVHQAAEQLS